jgi:hypothetical protein
MIVIAAPYVEHVRMDTAGRVPGRVPLLLSGSGSRKPNALRDWRVFLIVARTSADKKKVDSARKAPG